MNVDWIGEDIYLNHRQFCGTDHQTRAGRGSVRALSNQDEEWRGGAACPVEEVDGRATPQREGVKLKLRYDPPSVIGRRGKLPLTACV